MDIEIIKDNLTQIICNLYFEKYEPKDSSNLSYDDVDEFYAYLCYDLGMDNLVIMLLGISGTSDLQELLENDL